MLSLTFFVKNGNLGIQAVASANAAEWLNSIEDMHPFTLAYFGEEGSVTKYVRPHYTARNFFSTTPLIDVGL